MTTKTIALTMGLGAAAGAIAIMLMPRDSAPRKLAYKAAAKVEDAASMAVDKITEKMDRMM